VSGPAQGGPPLAQPAPEATKAAAHETLASGLRKAHALEKQAITIMEAQLGLPAEFPDMHAAVTAHSTETREQARRRLEAGPESCGVSTSMIRDTVLTIMGLGQSSVQGFSDDDVLEAMPANAMTEHEEVATCRSPLTLADMAGKTDLRPRLGETLREE
jgi:ferritin-like metal-binding protein YciE